MRVTGGDARGIELRVPRGDAVRPATDRLRQAVFSSLAARVPGCRFADVFAGSGAYGLEAVSRGAASGVFVERHAATAALLRGNLAAVLRSARREEDADAFVVVVGDALGTPAAGGGCDLVFVDPPWEAWALVAPRLGGVLEALVAGRPDPVVVAEMPSGAVVTVAGFTEVHRVGGNDPRSPSARFLRRTPS